MKDDNFTHSKPPLDPPTLALSRAVPLDLVDMASQIQQADQMLGCVTTNKLRVIAEQIRSLQQRAREILEEARQDSDLHRAECRFRKRPGQVYHLYRRSDDTTYFSMLSPQDWRGSPPDPFVGSYRLELDMSFTPLDEVAKRDAQDDVLHRLLCASEEA